MIHAYAIEPEVTVGWSDKTGYRFIRDKFGLGTPRVFLEIQKFSKWKKAVYEIAKEKGLDGKDLTRLAALFDIFADHRVRRRPGVYENTISWLENTENEYNHRWSIFGCHLQSLQWPIHATIQQ